MTALLIHVCAACDATSPPAETIPSSWELFDDGTRLLCSRCSALRRSGLSGSPQIADRAFVERLGMSTVPVRETPTAQAVCSGCKEAFPVGSGSEFCVGCTAKRANPRNFRPEELRAVGLDPKVVFGEGKVSRTAEPTPLHPRQAERLARDEKRGRGWNAQ